MSWEQLRGIIDSDAQERHMRETTPPVACPNDGEPLRSKGDGVLFCPWGDWQWPRDEGTAMR
jgi:hypothetical protein